MQDVAKGTFLLTRPSRGVTVCIEIKSCTCTFLLTRPSRGVTLLHTLYAQAMLISTHTPLAGRDIWSVDRIIEPQIISTHTPLAGRDPGRQTPSVVECISTHTPLAGRDSISIDRFPARFVISTHTPLAGRDVRTGTSTNCLFYFYSHAPRGA